MKKISVLLFIVIFGWLSLASYQIHDYSRQINKLNVVDSLTVGESFNTNALPAIKKIQVNASNADTMWVIIRNPTTAGNDTASIRLH